MLKPVCSLAPIKDAAEDICCMWEQSDSVPELSQSGEIIILSSK